MNQKTMDQKTMVPDTLDLAWHGSQAINGILGGLDLDDSEWERYCLGWFNVHPAYMFHCSGMVSGIHPKFVEALALLRQMTGSTEQMDIEKGLFERIIANCAGDGMLYDRETPKRPWNTGVIYGIGGKKEDYANMGSNGRLLSGFILQYMATGDESWKKYARRLAERMLELAVVKGDYAYYPNPGIGNDFSYPASGWPHTNEPQSAKEGVEESTIFYQLIPLRGWTRWYALTGDERFLDLSRKFARFGMQPKWWGHPNDIEPQAGRERGHFAHHSHSHCSVLYSLLGYAVAAGDSTVKQFVRDGYDFMRQYGIHRLGFYPAAHPMSKGKEAEGCTISDMVHLAIGMTDAGMGDYWDDVEQVARNLLVEAQLLNREEMERLSLAGPERPANAPLGPGWGDGPDGKPLPGQVSTDRVIERSIGGFGSLGPCHVNPVIGPCDSANMPIGIYHAWEGIVRREGDAANVNMWLNRRSPWADVWSWLPYEGRVMVRNKGMKRITVRLPGWTSRRAVVARVNGRAASPEWIGNRAVFAGLKGNEEIVLEVPVKTEKASYTVAYLHMRPSVPDTYACEFRGHTAISVKGDAGSGYRTFQREAMRAEKAPLKPAPAYIHPENLVRLT